jgi:TusA-related sulfurtransferase
LINWKQETEILADVQPPVAVSSLDTASMITTPPSDLSIDITGQLCPMTFVRTRLALDRLAPGQVLAVRLQGDEPRRNVPRTAAEQGHAILAMTEQPDGTATLLIRKGGLPAATPAG